MHHGRRLLCWGVGAFAAVLLGSGTGYAVSFEDGAGQGLMTAPDVVRIDVAAARNALEMAPVVFPHSKHTEKISKLGKDCTACHIGLDGKSPFAYRGLPGKLDSKAIEQQFHDFCFACHKELEQGPGTLECRVCHDAKASAKSSAVPVKFNRSLHALHVSSKLIAAPDGTQENCGACHHVFNKAQNKLEWAKGQEESCSVCHKPVAAENTPSLKTASHASCVKCHLEQTAMQQKAGAAEVKTGPVQCEACHTAAGQAKFPVLKDVPRILRGQPDAAVLLPEMPQQTSKAGIKPVLFNHKAHEGSVDSCQVCHHIRIDDKGCSSCHTTAGSPDGKFVQLEQSMHDFTSEHSCIGCHRKVTLADKNCAGCHTFVKPQASENCAACHAANLKDASELAKLDKDGLQKYAAEELAKRKAVKPVDPADMPETVTIGHLMDSYEPAVMPHRKIYEALVKGYADNPLASQFHTAPETACSACHHKVPAAGLKQPPQCASCHGIHQDKLAVDKNMPSLKAAYHQQCMTCHAKMDVKPVATDCQGCHAARSAQAGR